MRFIKYSLFLVSLFLCGVLGYAALALTMIINQSLPLPAIDGSGQYIYYPPSTATFLVIVSVISAAIPVFIISFIPSKETSKRGCSLKLLINGFKFLFLFSVLCVAGYIFGVNGFLLVSYGLAQSYGIPFPLTPPPTLFPNEGNITLMLFGVVMMLSPMGIVVGILIVLKIITMVVKTLLDLDSSSVSSGSSSSSSDYPYDPYAPREETPQETRYRQAWEKKQRDIAEREQEQEDQRQRERDEQAQEEREQEQRNQWAREEADREWQRKQDEEEEYNRERRGY